MLHKNEYKKSDMTLIVGDFNVDARDPLRYDTKTMLGLCPVLKVSEILRILIKVLEISNNFKFGKIS